MTKHKRVAAILLSIMIVFTFMPTMAFADDTAAAFKVTLASGTTLDGTYTWTDAYGRVDKGGKITATAGTISENLAIGTGVQEFTVDLTAATLTGGAKVTTTAGACLVNNNEVYSYHSAHVWEDPVATPHDADPSYADVTVLCKNGHSYDVQTVQATSSTASQGFVTYTAKLDKPADLTDEQKALTWTVAESAVTDTYVLGTVSYRQDRSGLAVLDAEGKVQFTAEYYKNTVKQADLLAGEIVSKTAPTNTNEKPTTERYGYHNYTVKFKFPNGQYSDPATLVENVADQDYAAPTVQDVQDVEYLFKDEAGNEFWGLYGTVRGVTYTTQDTDKLYAPFTYVTGYGTANPTQSAAQSADATKFSLAMASDNNVTYRLKFRTDKTDYYVYGDAAQSTLDNSTETIDYYASPDDMNNGVFSVQSEKRTQIFDCGTKVLCYKETSVSYKSGSDIKKYTFTPCGTDFEWENVPGWRVDVKTDTRLVINSAHEYSNYDFWADSFTQATAAGHGNEGSANAKCKYCGKEWTGNSYVIPKTADHTLKTENGAVVVKTVDATCKDYGFQYNICTVNDNGWTTGNTYELVLDKKTGKTYTFPASTKDSFKNADGTYGHPVLVDGSVKDKTAHNAYATASATITWASTAASVEAAKTTDDVYATVPVSCRNCEASIGTMVFHTLSFADAKKLAAYSGSEWKLDKDSEDTVTFGTTKHVFGGLTPEVTEGADCTKFDSFKYTVKGLTLNNGSSITKTFESAVYTGPHKHVNKVVFSDDGKTANVLQSCENKDCKKLTDVKGNKATQEKAATVTEKENADGSTTYTATLEGVELTNNTKTVYDLTKAEIVVNGGKEVDLNDYSTKEAIKELVVVTINGTELEKDIYNVTIGDLIPGNIKVEVSAKNVSTGTATKGKKESTFKAIKPAVFTKFAVKYDGHNQGSDAYNKLTTVTYDGTTHVVTAVAQDKTGDVKDATVKFAVVKDGYLRDGKVYDKKGNEVKLDKATYDLDQVELTDAATYVVLVKASKEGYTDEYDLADVYIINQIEVEKHIVVGAQRIKYGEQLTASTGDTELDKTIGLKVADTTKLGVGEYDIDELVSVSDNYAVQIDGTGLDDVVVIEKRNATIVMLSDSKVYDGKAADVSGLFEIDGAVNGDTLNVEVNVKGGKAPKNAGTYTLVATANDANYNIETVTAVYTVNKASQKVKSITPAKKSVKAGKSFKLKANTTGDANAKVTFKKTSGSKQITVSKSGKVKVKKGTKKGTYTIKVKATKAATKNYKKASKSQTIKVTVK